MPSPATSLPLAVTVTVLAALWVTSGRCGASAAAGAACDDGKLNLDMDLPAEAFDRECGVSTWAESTQRLPSVDTVYDPEPAREICMNESISYNHTVPNSGAFRPVKAESGEYLYCPPQRWLNNVHRGAPVLLYHPCAPLHERYLLSALARSCLPDYILTPHPQLNRHQPVALVSWGRTLKLATAASADICDWLQATETRKKQFDGFTQTRQYNLLLIRSAGLRQLQRSPQMKDSLRQCCERSISSLLRGTSEAEPSVKEERWIRIKEGGKSRAIRAAIRRTEKSTATNVSNATIVQREADVQNSSSALDSSGLGAFQSQKGGPKLHTAGEQPIGSDPRHQNASAGMQQRAFSEGVNSEQNRTARPEALSVTSKHEGTDSIKHRGVTFAKSKMKGKDGAEGKMKDNDVVDVEERELEHTIKHGGQGSESSASKSHTESQRHQSAQSVHSHTGSTDCGGCDAGERCDCTRVSGAETGAAAAAAAAANQGLLQTPRTDEAMWAAAALGFLLVLLTLSILHTRLYRNWRTTPSLYWHDPRQDYDSVADVIRRRLRIAKRRRKRGRKQECVLLPSSSSSDEGR